MELPLEPGAPLPGMYLKNSKTPLRKNVGAHMLTAAQFATAEIWKQLRLDA